MAQKKILGNSKSELELVSRFNKMSLSKTNKTRITKETESVTVPSSSSTKKIPRTSSRLQKKAPEECKLVRTAEKVVTNKAKISTAVSKSSKTTIQSSKAKSSLYKKSNITAKNNLKKNKVDSTIKKFKCTKCDKSFHRKPHLIDHIRTHTGEKPHKCYYCNHSFALKSNLIKHVRIHLGKKPFVCKICQRSFTLKKNMIEHEQTHSNEKLYECTSCKQRFKRHSSAIRHLRIHTEKYLECYECCTRFIQRSSLLRHIKTKHLENKSWQPRCCNDILEKEDIIPPEIVFVNCEEGDFALLLDNMEDGPSPIDEINGEIKPEKFTKELEFNKEEIREYEEENEELVGSSEPQLCEAKKELVVVLTPIVITDVRSLAGSVPTTSTQMTPNESENFCRSLCVKMERMKILPIKMEKT